MGDPRGYYRLLGVPRSASAEEIRVAFRARAMASHPDRQGANGSDDEVFRMVREAYEVLRDPRRRMAYDAEALAAEHQAQATARAAAQAAGSNDQNRRERAARAPRPAARRWKVGNAVIDRWLGRALPIAAGVLSLALVVAMASLWAARSQLDEREVLLADLYGRLNRAAVVEAELRAQLRSATFLDLERAMRRGPIAGDVGRYAYAETIAFPVGGVGLGPTQEERLTLAIIELAQRIEVIPGDVDWLIVLEAQAAAAADDDGVVVEAWEPALLRLASVLDYLLAQGLPSERMAIRFNAGFAAYPASGSDREGLGDMRDAVAVRLVCCVD